MTPICSVITLLGALLTAPALAQDEVPSLEGAARVTGRVPEEVNAFRDVRERYSERVNEFDADTRRFFEERKQAELDKISEGYDELLDSLREQEQHRRTQAIQRLTDFLDRYPEVEDSDNVRFRLAELWYEQAKLDWIDATRTFEEEMAAYDAQEQKALDAADAGDESLLEELPEPPDPPKKDVAKSVGLYTEILTRNEGIPPEQRWEHLDRVHYTLGFAYKDNQNLQYDLEAAQASFESLVTNHPDSRLVDAANLFLGNLLFNEKKEFEAAIAKYQLVYDAGPEGQYYYEAMFQLAWTHYKLAGFDPRHEEPALELFTVLLDDSEQRIKDRGRESDFAPDARLNMARTFADIADRYDRNPVEVAESYFNKAGPRGWERQVYVQLAEVLAGCVPKPEPCPPTKQNRGLYMIDEGIAVYRKLQDDPRWVNEPDNPKYQMKIIWLLPYRTLPDDRDVPLAQKEFTDRYSETIRDPVTGEVRPNPWWVANRKNPEVLDLVRRFIENSLAEVAVGMRVEAQEADDPEMYAAAAEKFREYLDRFPIADNYYQHQWFLADTLMRAQSPDPMRPWLPQEQALKEYESLVRSAQHHPYGDGAIFQRMRALNDVVISKHGPLDALPEAAVVEKSVTTEAGKEVVLHKLSDDHAALIDAMNAVVAHEFSAPTEEEMPDYREAYNDNLPYLVYTPGLVLFFHNRYDEARKQLYAAMDGLSRCTAHPSLGGPDHPKYQERLRQLVDTRSRAGRLIVKSYELEGNLAQVREVTGKFNGDLCMDADTQKGFGTAQKHAAFLQCQALIDKEKRGEAAECFETYMAEFPTPKSGEEQERFKFALYNAANNYELVGQAEKANTLFEQYVALYPTDPASMTLYVRIASNYEATFDLQKAIQYYERLVKADKKGDFQGTPDAVYNIAFLKIGLGWHRGAAEGFEAYAKRYPDRADSEEVYFQAGAEWERVRRAEAYEFYKRYLWKYNLTNGDHALRARYKIAEEERRRGEKGKHRWHMNKLLEMHDEIIASGQEIGPTGRKYVAEAAFFHLQNDYDEFTKDKLFSYQSCRSPSTDDCPAMAKNNKLLESKDAALPEFEKKALELVTKYQDFEYATAAIYLMGAAQLYIAELGYEMEVCADRWDEEVCDIWYEIFDESFRPLFDEFQQKAVTRLEKLIEKAETEKQHTVWVDKAYETLNRLDPFNYPDMKLESRGAPSAEDVPEIKGISIEPPEAEAVETPDEGTPDEGEGSP